MRRRLELGWWVLVIGLARQVRINVFLTNEANLRMSFAFMASTPFSASPWELAWNFRSEPFSVRNWGS
jgi:hypothetical protein